MQREIKFRAWYDEEDEVPMMLGPTSIMDLGADYYGASIDGIYIGEHLKLMQYTGLKDKNDKEIYEEDIIGVAGKGVSIVKFMDGAFTASTLDGLNNGALVKDVLDNLPLYVIGNVYENPELLSESE